MKLHRPFLTTVLTTTALVGAVQSPAFALDSFGGNCASQGQWTRSALSQSKEIESAIVALRDDPACKGIESVLPRVQEAQRAFVAPTGDEVRMSRSEELESRKSSLRGTLGAVAGTVLAPEVGAALLAAEVESKVLPREAYYKAAKNAANSTVVLVDEVMKQLPAYDLCLKKHPNQLFALVGATIQIAGATASSGEGSTSRLGNMVANISAYMRNSDFASALKGPNESRYWASMSCLMETSAEAYCSANEAYALLAMQDQTQQSDKAKGSNKGLLDGYFLLSRELPTVSEWLQKVQFGVTPKISSDSNFKNTTLDAMNNLLKAVNGLRGFYAEELQQYQTLTNIESKRNMANDMIEKLSRSMMSNAGSAVAAYARGGGEENPGDRNFFINSVTPEVLPYYLIGRDKIPPEIIEARNKNGHMTPFKSWVVGDGSFQPDFKDPDHLMKVIEERMNNIVEDAMQKGSAYFRQRMVVDSQNLVSESMASNNLSVTGSLKNIRDYLSSLEARARKDSAEGAKIAPSIQDTVRRIDKVLASYDSAQKKAEEVLTAAPLVDKLSTCTDEGERAKLVGQIQGILEKAQPGLGNTLKAHELDEDLKKKLNKVYEDMVQTVYDEFNVLLQRDGFLANRVTTFVKYDYAERLKHKENMSEYQKQILTVAGRSMLDHLEKVNGLNPVQTEQDLSSAQVINTKNLGAVESTFAPSMHEAIDNMTMKTGGNLRGEAVKGKPMWGTRKDVVVKGTGDENGAHEQFRARLCVQTLGFDDWEKYAPYCKGSVLKSRFQEHNPELKKLNVVYDDLAREKKQGAGGRSKYVCALRNYQQQNQAYFLIHQPQ